MQYFFSLVCKERKPFVEYTPKGSVYVMLHGHIVEPTVKKRTFVQKGTLLAVHGSPNVGDAHATVDGIVANITDQHVEITPAVAPEGAALHTIEPVSFAGLEGVALAAELKKLGVNVRPFTRPCETFIVNGINPEPGMEYSEELLHTCKETLEAGLVLAKRLSHAKEYLLVVPDGDRSKLDGATRRTIRAEYPNSLARPLIKAITGKESSANITLVRLHSLYLLGLVAQSGLPLTQTVLTAQGLNVTTALGTSVSELLTLAKADPESGDTILLGGAMRGRALANGLVGIDQDDSAVLRVPKGTQPSLEDNPCIGCGACVYACPMRLRPNMLSRYAEFEQYANCKKEYIELCIECGLCGYVCPACRPMQQYFRMAKHALGLTVFQHVKS